MPTYRFQAINPQGQTQTGTLHADSPQAAMKQLQAQGYLLQQLVRLEEQSAQVPPVIQQTAPGAPPALQKQARPWEDSVLANKQLGLFFDQLYAFLKAGYGVAEAMRLLTGRVMHPELSKACQEMAEGAARGERLSAMMERYPRLFPEYVIGNIRAGEVGGYLPDAAFELARYNEGWHKLRLWYWIPRTCLLNALLTAPVWAGAGVILMNGLLTYSRNPQMGVVSALMQAAGGWFFQWVLPIWGAVLFAWGMWRWVLSPRMERQRARAARGMPLVFGYSNWIQTTCVQMFLKHLSRLYNTGMSPATTWEMAVHSVPNLSIAEQLRAIQLNMGENAQNIDSAIARSGLFPPEQVALLSTAVQTGDVTGMLDRLTTLYDEESKHHAARARLGILRLAALIALIGFGAGCIGFAYNYYGNIFHFVDEFMGEP